MKRILCIAGLAALYAGHGDARSVARTGLLEASDADLESLATIFPLRAPWMRDHF